MFLFTLCPFSCVELGQHRLFFSIAAPEIVSHLGMGVGGAGAVWVTKDKVSSSCGFEIVITGKLNYIGSFVRTLRGNRNVTEALRHISGAAVTGTVSMHSFRFLLAMSVLLNHQS